MSKELPGEHGASSDESGEAPQVPAARFGRRAIMLGAAAGGAGLTASLLVGAEPAEAMNGKPVELGEANTATATTSITTTTGNGFEATTSENTKAGLAGFDTSSANGFGLYGKSTNGTGAYGQTKADLESGVEGVDASPGGGIGVQGMTAIGVGVKGEASDNGTAVLGTVGVFNGLAGYFTNLHNSGGVSPAGGTAVRALASKGTYDQLRNTAGGEIKGYGAGEFAGQNGIIAAASGETVGTIGLVGIGPNNYGTGVFGYGRSGSDGFGVHGLAAAPGGWGVFGQATGAATDDPKDAYAIGVYGENDVDPNGYGVYAYAVEGTAFNADGNAGIQGTLSKSGGAFKIDHPVEPAHKFLYHSFVESPDMMNVYNGTVVLDDAGRATVKLPDFFEALNKDFRYQLTAIGSPAPDLHVAAKVADNTFAIAGGRPHQEVSWQVTGVRQDAWANANRIAVEVDKREEDQGRYLHPELFEDGHGRALTSIARMRERAKRQREATSA